MPRLCAKDNNATTGAVGQWFSDNKQEIGNYAVAALTGITIGVCIAATIGTAGAAAAACGPLSVALLGATYANDRLLQGKSEMEAGANLAVGAVFLGMPALRPFGPESHTVFATRGVYTSIPYGPAPQHVQQVLSSVDNTGASLPGFHSGGAFRNREGRLPSVDDFGNAIRYSEWDVHVRVPGVNRGPERLVTGSDGAAYYTSDHYGSFTQLRSPTW